MSPSRGPAAAPPHGTAGDVCAACCPAALLPAHLLVQKLVLMYVVLEVAAGLIKGQSPLRHLLLAAVHLKMVFQAMLAPLSMMCSGFVLALVQYSLLVKKQQRAGMRSEGASDAAAAAQGKSKAE